MHLHLASLIFTSGLVEWFEANQRDIEMLDRIAEKLKVDRDALLRATVVSIMADYLGKRELIRKGVEEVA